MESRNGIYYWNLSSQSLIKRQNLTLPTTSLDFSSALPRSTSVGPIQANAHSTYRNVPSSEIPCLLFSAMREVYFPLDDTSIQGTCVLQWQPPVLYQ